MKKILLIGRTGCGKTTLTQILNHETMEYRKTQSINYSKDIIDTPGEYIENRGYYRALIVSAADCDIVGFVQDAQDEDVIFPPFFAQTLNKPAIGIITKKDLVKSTDRAKRLLASVGIDKCIITSCKTKEGIDRIKEILLK